MIGDWGFGIGDCDRGLGGLLIGIGDQNSGLQLKIEDWGLGIGDGGCINELKWGIKIGYHDDGD